MQNIYEVEIHMRKARNGWTVEVEPRDRDGCCIENDDGSAVAEHFVLPGDLDAEALGKEIVASLVSMRIGEPAKKRK